jgi:hypothetical protein
VPSFELTAGRRRLALGCLALAALTAARAPLHRATFALPVSNDDAIPLLMARHVLRGELSTILWNQPYNGTLDTYLLAPLVGLLGSHAAFRLYEAACGLLLVLAAGLLGRALAGETAGWAAAILAAVGTPYQALMAATGPTPNFLVPLLTAVPLLLGARHRQGRPSGMGTALLAGAVSGLAVWDSALALPALAGIGLGLLAAGWRPRGQGALAFAAGFAVGAAPLGLARAIGASSSSPVTALRPRWLWTDGLADLARASAGLFGVQVPLVVDGPERASLPPPWPIVLAVLLLACAALGAWRRAAWPVVGWAAALAVAFAFSRRTGGDEVRYLFGLALPVLALSGAGLARLADWRWPAAALAAAGLVVPWAIGHRAVLAAWRDPAHAARVWQVPPLDPVRDTLRRAHVESAYASLQFAGRLALETDEQVVASQAWNERIPGDPLRFRDEADLDPQAAWVLHPHLSRGMPRAGGMRDLLREAGGSWREDLPGEFVIFRRFSAPYDEARPVPASSLTVALLDGTPLPAAVLDRDPATLWTAPLGLARGSGLSVRLAPPRRLAALVLAVGLEPTPLAVPWIAEVDGTPVARGPLRHGLQWVNGVPRAGRQALLAVPLGDRAASQVRLIFQGEGPVLTLSEVFAYGPDEAPQPGAGRADAAAALLSARRGDWDDAVRRYAQALRLEPERAAHHACLARARWRAAHRRRLDVESLGDGGPELVGVRP